jgi:HupE/UreJ protein
MTRGRLSSLVTLLALFSAHVASAHNFGFTDVRLELHADGTFRAEVLCDVDALALGMDAGADSAELAARIEALPRPQQDELAAGAGEVLRRRIRVRFDDQPAPFAVTLPERGIRPPGSQPSALGLVAQIDGRIPAGARTVSFFASRAFPPVRLTVVGPEHRARPVEVLERGETSRPAPIAGAGAEESGMTVARRFLHLGFTHILPEGLDHVLFVLGLALLSSRLRPLLAQVTAFTLAHTLTLALAVYGVVSLPSRIVEPLIAGSIVYVSVENLVRTEATWTRLLVVFGFGLLHGLGFAGALSSLGWPQGRKLVALLAFNLGVELGQLAVIAIALGLLAALARLKLPRRRIEQGLSAGIALVALVWTVQRLV